MLQYEALIGLTLKFTLIFCVFYEILDLIFGTYK